MHTPEGELENTGFGAFTGDAAVGWHGPRGGATLRYVRYGGEFKLLEAGGPPSGGQEGEGEEGGPERKLSDDRLQLESEFPVGPVRLEAKAQLERHELIELSDEVGGGGLRDFPRLRPATMPSLPVASRSEQEAFHLLLKTGTLDLLAHHDLGSGVGGTIGASGELQSNDSRGPIPLVPDLTTQSGAVFLYEEARFGRLSLLGGARTEARSFTREKDPAANSLDVDRSFHEITANGGIVLRLPHAVAAAGNVGRAWRAPTFFELYGGGPLLAEARFLFANHRLRQETSLDLDGSIRLEQPERRGEISVYRNAVDDFIVLSPTSEEINGLQVWKYRQVDAVLLGVDAALDTRVSGPFWLHGRIDYVKGEEEASDAPLPSIPPMRGAVGARLATGGLSWADRLQIELEVEMVADKKARDAAANEVVTGGYALLNGGASVSRCLLYTSPS
ncbi:MAG: TonB-dependent receptor, partial [Candidatus Eisenbacteria bacterium]|nr:TonB-dependent receptor [Candidatus Eisenbacteria bacterium]